MTSRAMAAAVWLVALVSLAGGAEGQLVQYTDNATGWTSSESGAELISDAQCRVVRPGARTPRASDARARAEARFRANLRRFRGARAPGRAPRPARVGAPGTRSPGRAVASTGAVVFFFPIITSRLLPPPDAASRFLDRSRDASPHETRPSHETHRPTPPLRLSPSAARGVRRVFGGPGVRVVRRAEPESGSQSAVHVPVRDVRVPRADQAGADAAGPRGRVPRLRRAVRRHRAERPVHRRPRVRVVRGDGAVPLRICLRRAL